MAPDRSLELRDQRGMVTLSNWRTGHNVREIPLLSLQRTNESSPTLAERVQASRGGPGQADEGVAKLRGAACRQLRGCGEGEDGGGRDRARRSRLVLVVVGAVEEVAAVDERGGAATVEVDRMAGAEGGE